MYYVFLHDGSTQVRYASLLAVEIRRFKTKKVVGQLARKPMATFVLKINPIQKDTAFHLVNNLSSHPTLHTMNTIRYVSTLT